MATKLVYADSQGRIFDHPYLHLAGRSGREFFRLVPDRDLIPLPPGSDLFVLPGRRPVGYDSRRRRFVTAGDDRSLAASCPGSCGLYGPGPHHDLSACL